MADNKNQAQGKSLGTRIALIVAAAAIVCIAHFIPCPEGLTYAGKMAIGLMVAGIVLWVTEPVPMAHFGFGDHGDGAHVRHLARTTTPPMRPPAP